jgi:hypothetical protein
MTIIKQEDYYYGSELDYYLDSNNVADCKYQESINGFDVLGLNENESQFMIFNNAGEVFYIVDTTLEQVKEFLTMFY